jgi:hypothetical protein
MDRLFAGGGRSGGGLFQLFQMEVSFPIPFTERIKMDCVFALRSLEMSLKIEPLQFSGTRFAFISFCASLRR